MLAQLDFNINNEFFKYVVLALTSPWWTPFFKELWSDFNDALHDEGGLLGYAPSASKLNEINRERGAYDSVLVSEPYPSRGAMQSRAPRQQSGASAGSSRGRSTAQAAPAGRRTGFRDPSERGPRGFG